MDVVCTDGASASSEKGSLKRFMIFVVAFVGSVGVLLVILKFFGHRSELIADQNGFGAAVLVSLILLVGTVREGVLLLRDLFFPKRTKQE